MSAPHQAEAEARRLLDLAAARFGKGAMATEADANNYIDRRDAYRDAVAARVRAEEPTCSGCGSLRRTAWIAVMRGKVACCPDCSTMDVGERNAMREEVAIVYARGRADTLAEVTRIVEGMLDVERGRRTYTDVEEFRHQGAEGALEDILARLTPTEGTTDA